MAWTENETQSWRSINDAKLAEINSSLRPDSIKGSGKVGIFCHGQVGDLATAMSVLKYRKELWGDKEIVWFANWPNADLLRYAPIDEVRMWPWAGNGLPEDCPDFYPLLCDNNNRLDKDIAKNYELTADLEDGYFPAPHMITPQHRHGIDYPNCSRRIFGVDPSKEWHPYLTWTDQEIEDMPLIQTDRKTIMIETFCGSGQSLWDDLMTVRSIELCMERWGSCNFLFASHKNTEQFKDFEGYYSLSHMTPREAALAINYCELFIGISSGISVVTSAWGLKPVPKMQYCGSHICSTVTLATGEINLITTDGIGHEFAKQQFFRKLRELISRIQ